MPRKTKVEDGEAAGSSSGPITIATITVGGQFVRAYSLEVHGENFAELAQEFAAQDPKRAIELA